MTNDVKKKLLLSCLLVVLLVFLFVNFLFKPKSTSITKLNKKHSEVSKLLDTSKGYVNRYKSVRIAVDSMTNQWNSLAKCLPSEEEMPYLLRGIAEAGRLSNVQFLLFKPLPGGQQTNFYKENPVQIKINCTYHELGYFLSKITALERLVNVSKFKLSTNKKADRYTEVDFIATAYTLPSNPSFVDSSKITKKK
ncbi:MAG: type 4a pilus biogenesis protein PilO [bacterium]